MPAPDLVHALLGALRELPAARWTCSVDNVRKGPITEHHVGLRDGTTAWARWTFVVDGHEHALEIERDAGTSKATFDGLELEGVRIRIHPTTHSFALIIVVICDYQKADGSAGEYRFDGTEATLLG